MIKLSLSGVNLASKIFILIMVTLSKDATPQLSLFILPPQLFRYLASVFDGPIELNDRKAISSMGNKPITLPWNTGKVRIIFASVEKNREKKNSCCQLKLFEWNKIHVSEQYF